MDEFSSFYWARGDPSCWRLSIDKRMRRPPLLVYKGKWSPLLLEMNAYRPLDEAPRLFEKFAALGKQVEEAGQRLGLMEKLNLPMVSSLPMLSSHGAEAEPAPGTPASRVRMAGYAAYIPRLQRQALQFVQVYGPLDFLPEWRFKGWLLTDFFIEAAALHMTMRFAQELQDADMRDTEHGLVPGLQLIREFNIRLSGVNPCLELAEGRLAAGYMCDSLLTAMWLQFYEALAHGKSWRLCKGCGRLFTQARRGQKFHDSGCRNRYHVRHSPRAIGKEETDVRETSEQ